MVTTKGGKYILGIDLGANSIGWALLEAGPSKEGDGKLKPFAIKKAGVRVFEAGVEGDIESGKDESRSVSRRNARGARRRIERTARRMSHLFHLLQKAGFLPAGDGTALAHKEKGKHTAEELREFRMKAAAERHKIVNEFDLQFLAKLGSKDELAAKKLPYLLRAKALDKKLEPFEFGRALYHLGQRRGFLSNRKANSKKDDELGKVKQGILELEGKMEELDARTLGEYFSKTNPEEVRIRSRWTSRKMYDDEFNSIWGAQSKHNPKLDDKLKKAIHRAIFFQRPLKIQHHLIGKCPYEQGRRRAPWAILDAQMFRTLQQVNNSYLISPEGEVLEFTPEWRKTLLDELDKKNEIKFSAAKKLLGLKKEYQFNFEKDGKGEFLGNSTAEDLIDIFGEEKWNGFSREQKDEIIQDVLSIVSEDGLAKRGREKWGLSGEKAKEFGQLQLEEGYCGLSRQALKKLLPRMEKGKKYMEAVKDEYGTVVSGDKFEALPPITEVLPDLKNPTVKRALNELRKVVNAIVREYGKPDIVRIELAREMKKNRKERKSIWDRNQEQRTWREKAAEEIIREAGIKDPKRADIEKYLLWQESNCQCPYTGKEISIKKLFSGDVDVEHIIPFSRCLDNSFLNKTLCLAEENRNKKKNFTPFEAYAGSDPDQYAKILEGVKKFEGDAAKEKLRRFRMEHIKDFDDFTETQLNDTKYASKEAKKYIGLLYGTEQLSRVQASKGQITADVRNVFNLNKVLGDGGEKNREDHRHHAVDAVAIAVTDRSLVKMLSSSAAKAEKEFSPKKFDRAKIEKLWPSFFEDVKESIMAINVSHRVSKKVNGRLHQDTFYSPPKKDEQGKSYCCVRKPVARLSKGDIEDIMDPAVREAVQKKLKELGGDPKKVFQDPQKHPFLTAKDGRKIPIHKVRVKNIGSPFQVGGQGRERFVSSDTNHHLEIVEVKDKKGNMKWDGHVVSQFEAMRRLRGGEPVVKKDHPGEKFVCSLAQNESVQLKDDRGNQVVCTVKGISQLSAGPIIITLRYNSDARPTSVYQQQIKKRKELKRTKDEKLAEELSSEMPVFIFRGPESLRESNGKKILVDPLGNIRWAND